MNKAEPIRWIENDSIRIIDGTAWAINKFGKTYSMGTVEEALETIKEKDVNRKGLEDRI